MLLFSIQVEYLLPERKIEAFCVRYVCCRMKSVQGLKLDETTSKSGSGSRSRGLALMEFFCKLPHSASQFVRLYPMRCTYPVATFQRQEDIRGARMNFGDPTAATAPQ